MLITLMISRYLMCRRGLGVFGSRDGVKGGVSLSLSLISMARLNDGVICATSDSGKAQTKLHVILTAKGGGREGRGGFRKHKVSPSASLAHSSQITCLSMSSFHVSPSLSSRFVDCLTTSCTVNVSKNTPLLSPSPQTKRKIALISKWWYYIKRRDLIYQIVRTTPLLYVLHLNGIAGCQGHGGN